MAALQCVSDVELPFELPLDNGEQAAIVSTVASDCTWTVHITINVGEVGRYFCFRTMGSVPL